MPEPKKWPKWEDFKVMWEAGKAFFKNDGCTGVPNLDVRHCCEEHDYYYATHIVSRKEADKRFKACIQRQNYRFLDNIYYLGVRLFGGNAWKKHYDPNVAIPPDVIRIDEEDKA